MLLKNKIKKNTIAGIQVSSVGTGAFPGSEADGEMVDFLLDKDIPVEAHGSRMIIDSDIDWADLILVMENIHYDFILETWPGAGDKVEKLGKYIALDQTQDDIPDPYGMTPYHYRAAQSQITLAVSNLYKVISTNIT